MVRRTKLYKKIKINFSPQFPFKLKNWKRKMKFFGNETLFKEEEK